MQVLRQNLSSVGASISGLLLRCGPAAVAWFVVAVVIDAVERVGRRRTQPHVGDKFRESVPTFANRDSAPSIDGIVSDLRVHAPAAHVLPRPILRRSFASMTLLLANVRSARLTEALSVKGAEAVLVPFTDTVDNCANVSDALEEGKWVAVSLPSLVMQGAPSATVVEARASINGTKTTLRPASSHSSLYPLESAGHVWFHDQFLECKNGGKK